MSFNKTMHDRNPYKKNPPNFTALAREYPELRKHCFITNRGTLNLNFADSEAVRILTLVLLRKDFGLTIELPHNSLVPRVPQRLNYLLFLEDLLLANGLKNSDVTGIDVGTGCSCIYPLMGAAKFRWKFVATEIDETSIKMAKSNVEKNGQTENITVMCPRESTILTEAVNAALCEGFTFSMCNPPFYDFEESSRKYSMDENNACENTVTEGGRPAPRSATVARLNELATEGGEVAFVLRMIEESMELRTRIRLFTSMVGIKASVQKIERVLKTIGDVRYVVSTLDQGRTQRFDVHAAPFISCATAKIRKEDCEQKYVSGWGPGGQKVNTAQNAVMLRHLPTGIVVKVHEHRLLPKNIDIAFERLKFALDRHVNGENCYEEQFKRLEKEREARTNRKRQKHRLRKQEQTTEPSNAGVLDEEPSGK
ncbi:hypothetical protein QR680_019126 [Steinernema hermaphroditum]|uniref:U6 small nuclear RNA (adenine-(43)-N(6))-methyltransferase n=1 Tax=Steinernema hermaphroditum TaxID=289476 RepID=A0AA39HK15_9BILA|nr:hypothetical protein QR680_019126 [Steinernema hermaphroditum]